MGICYAKLFEAAKIHVQIMRFTCCLNMAFNLTKSIWALICLHDKTRESVASLTNHFADAFVRKKRCTHLCRCGEVQMFGADAILLRETQCKKGIF